MILFLYAENGWQPRPLPRRLATLWRWAGSCDDGISDEIGKPSAKPGYDALEQDDEQHPFGAQFATDGGHGGHTRRVEQAEHQHGDARYGGE